MLPLFVDKMNIPKINIKYNSYLDRILIGYIKSLPEYKDWVEPTDGFLKDQVSMYKEVWNKEGEKVLTAICNVTGLEFKRNQIDVHVVKGNLREHASCIILKCRYSREEFLCVLIHELIHCLINDNYKVVNQKHYYEDEDQTTKSHVLIHAILKYVYLDIIREKLLFETNIKRSLESKVTGYMKAWDIVEREGYMNLIEKFKLGIK